MFLNIWNYSGSFLVWFVTFENFGNVFAIRTLMFGGGSVFKNYLICLLLISVFGFFRVFFSFENCGNTYICGCQFPFFLLLLIYMYINMIFF